MGSFHFWRKSKIDQSTSTPMNGVPAEPDLGLLVQDILHHATAMDAESMRAFAAFLSAPDTVIWARRIDDGTLVIGRRRSG